MADARNAVGVGFDEVRLTRRPSMTSVFLQSSFVGETWLSGATNPVTRLTQATREIPAMHLRLEYTIALSMRNSSVPI